MPSRAALLAQLARIADEAFALSVLWHAVMAISAVAIAGGFRPTRRAAALFVSALLVSVAAVAFAFGNAFNGVVLGLVAIALGVLAPRMGQVGLGPPWSVGIGAVMIVFGWIYPHFLTGRSGLTYLYGAPVGVLPCPSLSVGVGVALMAGGLGTKAWMRILALTGIAYGLVGVFALHVALDAVLLAGSTALLVADVAAASPARPSAG